MILNNFYELQKLKTFAYAYTEDITTSSTASLSVQLNINYFSVKLMNGTVINNPTCSVKFSALRFTLFIIPTLSPYIPLSPTSSYLSYIDICGVISNYNYNPNGGYKYPILVTFGSDNTPPQLDDYMCYKKITTISFIEYISCTVNSEYNEVTTLLRFRNTGSNEITIRELTINSAPSGMYVTTNLSVIAIYREVFDDVVVPPSGDFILTYKYSLTTGEPNVSVS